jgi:hypothetical protein
VALLAVNNVINMTPEFDQGKWEAMVVIAKCCSKEVVYLSCPTKRGSILLQIAVASNPAS